MCGVFLPTSQFLKEGWVPSSNTVSSFTCFCRRHRKEMSLSKTKALESFHFCYSSWTPQWNIIFQWTAAVPLKADRFTDNKRLLWFAVLFMLNRSHWLLLITNEMIRSNIRYGLFTWHHPSGVKSKDIFRKTYNSFQSIKIKIDFFFYILLCNIPISDQ